MHFRLYRLRATVVTGRFGHAVDDMDQGRKKTSLPPGTAVAPTLASDPNDHRGESFRK